MNAFAVYCGPSQAEKPAGNRHRNVSRRPAVIGAVPLYFLIRAGHELKAALPSIRSSLVPKRGHAEVIQPPTVGEALRMAANTAAKELEFRDSEIYELQERCEHLMRAITLANKRADAISDGRTESELAETAARFERCLTSASCRAVRAEREAETLQEQLQTVERELADHKVNSVKTNAAIAAIAVALITFWARNMMGSGFTLN